MSRSTSNLTNSDKTNLPDISMLSKPDKLFNVRKTFDIDLDMEVKGFSKKTSLVPDLDPNYFFDLDTTHAILAGFRYNRRVMIQGFHGTGKSSHILKDGKQVTQFQEGLLPWALEHPCALIFDEYDAGRPDVMFVIQRVLETEGKLTLLDQNRVIRPDPSFRLFATANTIGLGDTTGLYHGTQQINQGQMDRWNIVAALNYLPPPQEIKIIMAKMNVQPQDAETKKQIESMVALANLTRIGFAEGELSTVMSPRTVISWAENYTIFHDLALSFRLTFLNKCDLSEHGIVAEYYQRCFNVDLLTTDPKTV